MKFAIYLPEQGKTRKLPLLWYLSGLTCTHANVMEKGEYRKLASELDMIIICPDTSPRGNEVPDEPDNWQFGSGAGFYLDATERKRRYEAAMIAKEKEDAERKHRELIESLKQKQMMEEAEREERIKMMNEQGSCSL